MTTLVVIQNNLFYCISFRTFLVLVCDILEDFLSSFMTTLAVIQNNLGHYFSLRTFLVLVYDCLRDFWSSFMTTLIVIQNYLGYCISFRTFLIVVYGIFLRLLGLVYNNIGSCRREFTLLYLV